MDFLEDILVYPNEWSALCTVRRETLIGVLLLKSAVISFKVVLRAFFTSLESVRSPLTVTNLGLPFRGLFSTFPRSLQRFKNLEIVDLFMFKLSDISDTLCPLL